MRRLVASMAAVALMAGQASAQAVRESPTGRTGVDSAAQQRTTAAQQGSENKLDKQIAACLLLGNQEEVALAQFAQERAQNEQVKQFAQTMIEQHQQAISKIEQAAPQVASLNLNLNAAGAAEQTTPGQQGQPAPGQPPQATDQPGATAAQQTPRAAAPSAEGDMQGLQLAKQIKEQCLSLTKAELGEKQGAEFDKCYMAQQIGAHIVMLAELRASKNFASAELQPVLQEGEQMTQSHLAEAKQIVQRLDSASGQRPQTTRRPGETTPPRR